MAHLKDSTGTLLDPLQFAYRANRSVDDAVTWDCTTSPTSGQTRDLCKDPVWDFSSAFNTIIPYTLQNKLIQLSVPTSICQWITSFLTDRQQLFRLVKYTSSTRTISMELLRLCPPTALSLYTNDCTSKDPSVKLLKFADDTTVIGLIQEGCLLTDKRLSRWLSGAVTTTWS